MPDVAGFVRVTPNNELAVDDANHRAGLRVHGDTPTLG